MVELSAGSTKLIQYLNEAYGLENSATRTLDAWLALFVARRCV
jgi:hypothetical protein